MSKAPSISLTVWGYFTNTPGWGVSEMSLALMAYVVVVVRSSVFTRSKHGFHTLFEVESWGAVLLNRVMSLQNTHRSGALEMRTYAQCDRDCAYV